MASSSWSAFAKTIIIPLLIALTIYALAFLLILPLYRRHRARYSNYAPLSSSFAQRTTSLFEPYLIEPSKSLLHKVKDVFVAGLRRMLGPSDWAWERQLQTGSGLRANGSFEDDELDDGGLFDAESGEAMVGFDARFGNDGGRERGRRGGEREVVEGVDEDSNRRLSRELEEGFRDDSGSEASDEEVTAGRRSVSRRRGVT